MKGLMAILLVPLLIGNLAIPAHAQETPLLTPCGLSSPELAAALLCDLAPYADTFLQAEAETGINAIFLASVAALESGWGRYMAADNNIYGWTGAAGYMDFDSVDECILHVARSLKANYLSPDGPYDNGCTVAGVNRCYNGSPAWEKLVTQIMHDIERRAR